MIEAVLFDWGGTLTPWRASAPVDGWQAYADVAHPADADRVAAALVAADAARWAVVRDEHRAFTTAHVLSDAGAAEHPEALAAYRRSLEPCSVTDPEAAPMLRELRRRGLRLGVLSSTAWPAAWHEEWLVRDGILDLVDACVWSSDLEYTKPHPEAFRAAMAAVGVTDPAACVFVGDRPYDDISGAQGAGMRAVLVPHSEIPAEQQVPLDVTPDAVIQRLADLPGVLDRWAR